MRTLAIIGVIIGGFVLVSAVVAAATRGRDHSGDTVRASQWADATCGAVGAWEGDLEAIREELRQNNYAARMTDGGSGDELEGRVTVREAVDRAIRATEDTLQEGLKRAGIPDTSSGPQAVATMHAWAQTTEHDLRVAKAQIKAKPTSVAESFASLGPPVQALAKSRVQGRQAFAQIASSDPDLSSALSGSRNCERLKKDKP